MAICMLCSMQAKNEFEMLIIVQCAHAHSGHITRYCSQLNSMLMVAKSFVCMLMSSGQEIYRWYESEYAVGEVRSTDIDSLTQLRHFARH